MIKGYNNRTKIKNYFYKTKCITRLGAFDHATNNRDRLCQAGLTGYTTENGDVTYGRMLDPKIAVGELGPCRLWVECKGLCAC